MPYFSLTKSPLRERRLLERAMRNADMSGPELAAKIGANQQVVNGLRSGATARVRTSTAELIEAALSVPSGALFDHPWSEPTPDPDAPQGAAETVPDAS